MPSWWLHIQAGQKNNRLAHGTGPGNDVKLTPPTGCFGLCQLVFHNYFSALAHNVDSRVGLPDLPYFPGAPVFRPLPPVSRTEAKISRI